MEADDFKDFNYQVEAEEYAHWLDDFVFDVNIIAIPNYKNWVYRVYWTCF